MISIALALVLAAESPSPVNLADRWSRSAEAALAEARPALARRWTAPELGWTLWSIIVLAQGLATLIPIGAELATSPIKPNDVLFGGATIAFSVGAIVTAIAMLVYRGQGFWGEQAYWQAR